MTTKQGSRSDVEEAIDQCENFAEFLELVAEICNEKANHTQEEGLRFRDHVSLAEIWEKRARITSEVSDLVEHEILTGTTSLEIAGERIRSKYFVPIKSEKATQIKDEDVRMLWKCDEPECEYNGATTMIEPTFYQDSGNPMCEGDHEMTYDHTEIT